MIESRFVNPLTYSRNLRDESVSVLHGAHRKGTNHGDLDVPTSIYDHGQNIATKAKEMYMVSKRFG
jgi:hypothetical protein